MIAASIIQAATHGPWAMLGTRIMLGVGLGFAQTAAPPLTTEIAHPKHRGQVTALFQATWYWGAIISASIALGTLFLSNSWSWRTPCLLQALFPGLQMIGLLLTPESPRWLISKGRTEEAFAILARYHANGDTNDELVKYEFSEICEAIEKEREAAKTTGFMSFFETRGNRHRLLICVLVGIMIQWAGNGIVSYYLAPILQSVGVTSSVSQAGINLGMQVWNALLAAGGAIAAEKYGRRPLWMISACGMLASFIVITACSGVFAERDITAAGSAVVSFLFIFFGFYDIAFTPLSIAYPVEILPFRLRSKGLSINLTVVFGAGFFNQYVNPIALDAIHWKFYFVYIGTLTSMIFIIYFVRHAHYVLVITADWNTSSSLRRKVEPSKKSPWYSTERRPLQRCSEGYPWLKRRVKPLVGSCQQRKYSSKSSSMSIWLKRVWSCYTLPFIVPILVSHHFFFKKPLFCNVSNVLPVPQGSVLLYCILIPSIFCGSAPRCATIQ